MDGKFLQEGLAGRTVTNVLFPTDFFEDPVLVTDMHLKTQKQHHA
jgi:hypothetical protein